MVALRHLAIISSSLFTPLIPFSTALEYPTPVLFTSVRIHATEPPTIYATFLQPALSPSQQVSVPWAMSCSEDTTSVAQSLPVDVLREIFKHLSVPLKIGGQGIERDFPWYLGHVCSLWRAAFLSMRQEFWRKFGVRSGTELSSMEERYASVIDTFLRNNRGTPISFKIPPWARFPFILDRFLAESARIGTLNVTIEKRDIPLLMSIKNHIPLLHTLSLMVKPFDMVTSWMGGKPAKIPEDCCDIFKNAPLLTCVRLTSLSTWNFNWPSLTVLELVDEFSTDGLLGVLSQTTNLEKLLFHHPRLYQDMYGATFGGATLITLPRLKVLTVFALLLLPILTTPTLEELYVDHMREDPNWRSAPDIVASFLQQSSCKLKRLGVGWCSMKHLEAILQHTPEIKFLGVRLYPGEDKTYLYSRLAHSTGQALLAPSVHSFRMLYREMNAQSISCLKSMLASHSAEKCGPINRLREFTMVWPRNMDRHELVIDDLKMQCRNWGIQFRFQLEKGGGQGIHSLSGWDDDDDDF